MTKEENDRSFKEEDDNLLIMESNEYKRGYQNSVLDVQRQYNLRNRNVVINPNKDLVDQPSTSQPKKDASQKHIPKVANRKEDSSKEIQEGKKDVNAKEIEKIQSSFNLENEISNIKIVVPFNELFKNFKNRRRNIEHLKSSR